MPQVTVSTNSRKRRAPSTQKSKRTRTVTRNTNVNRSLVSVGRAFPKKIRTVLRYATDVFGALNPGSLSYAQLFFKANGLYDPEDAIGGHQPYGFDQYAAIYNHYHVYKSTCKVQWICPPATTEGMMVGVNITPGASDTDGATTKAEKQDGKKNYQWVCAQLPLATTYITWNDKQFFGVDRDNDRLGAAVTTDPTELSHFEIWCYNKDSVSRYQGAFVTIEYYVEFSEPKSLGQS